MQELTEEERQTLRTGLRMLARMIARHHLTVQAVQQGSERTEAEPEAAAAGSGEPSGAEQ